jgi:hypothetical protein
MKPYRLHEGDIQIPENWKDMTINSFVLPGDKGAGTASLVVSRDADTAAKDVHNYIDLQMVEAAKKLKGYKPVGRREVVVSGQPAVELTYTWTTPEKVTVQQRQVCVRQDQVFLVFTLTAKLADFPKYEDAWKAVIQSLRLRAV